MARAAGSGLISLFVLALALDPGWCEEQDLRELSGALGPAVSGLGDAQTPEEARDLGERIQAVLGGGWKVRGSGYAESDSPAGAPWKALAPGDGSLAVFPQPWEVEDLMRSLPPPPAYYDEEEAQKSNFSEVWGVVKKDPLKPPYPKEKVTFSSFFSGGIFRLLGSARRTVNAHRDLLPEFVKLIRPNGIALAGVWEVTEPTPYTGYFAQGSRALVIARASVFSDDTERGQYRSFGMAIKLYPTQDPSDSGKYKTANIFLIDDNGGTLTPHFTDAELTTRPSLTKRWGLVRRAPILAAVAMAQRMADKKPGYRQLYPVSELGVHPEKLSEARSPGRLMVRGAEGVARRDVSDFREELDASQYPPPGLVFDVFVSEDEKAPWQKIGRIRFTESAVSHAADHNLHFPHPAYRANPSKDKY